MTQSLSKLSDELGMISLSALGVSDEDDELKKKKKTGFEFGLSRGECINVYQRLSFNRGVTQLNTRNRAACDNVSMFNNIAPSEEVLHS